MFFFFFSSRRRHTRCGRDWSSDVCSSDLILGFGAARTPEWYRDQFPRPLDVLPWLKAQEDAVLNAFDPNDYIYQSWAYETHDVGATPGFNGDYAKALGSIRAKTLIMTG